MSMAIPITIHAPSAPSEITIHFLLKTWFSDSALRISLTSSSSFTMSSWFSSSSFKSITVCLSWMSLECFTISEICSFILTVNVVVESFIFCVADSIVAHVYIIHYVDNSISRVICFAWVSNLNERSRSSPRPL